MRSVIGEKYHISKNTTKTANDRPPGNLTPEFSKVSVNENPILTCSTNHDASGRLVKDLSSNAFTNRHLDLSQFLTALISSFYYPNFFFYPLKVSHYSLLSPYSL